MLGMRWLRKFFESNEPSIESLKGKEVNHQFRTEVNPVYRRDNFSIAIYKEEFDPGSG